MKDSTNLLRIYTRDNSSGLMNAKKVAKKTLVGLREPALEALNPRKKESGKSQTEIMNDLLIGADRFRPAVEEFIESEMKRRKLRRDETIEQILREVMEGSRKASSASRK